MTFHPWLSTPEAVEAAELAVRHALRRESASNRLNDQEGSPELLSEALVILTACALEAPQGPTYTECQQCGKALGPVRSNSKFCSTRCRKAHSRSDAGTLPDAQPAHVGSMWTWPEDRMVAYAVMTVGDALANYARTASPETVSWSELMESEVVQNDVDFERDPDQRLWYLFRPWSGRPLLRCSLEGNGHKPPSTAYRNQGVDLPW